MIERAERGRCPAPRRARPRCRRQQRHYELVLCGSGAPGACLRRRRVHGDAEYHGGQRASGMYQRFGGTSSTRMTTTADGQLGQLGPPARAVHHRGLGRAAVDHERAGQPGRQVGDPQADQVRVSSNASLCLAAKPATWPRSGPGRSRRSTARSSSGPLARPNAGNPNVGRPRGTVRHRHAVRGRSAA